MYPYERQVILKRLAEILKEVAYDHDCTEEMVVGRSRSPVIVAARHDFFYRCMSEGERGAAFVGRRYNFDHTTVLYGASKWAYEHGLPKVSTYNYKAHAARNRKRWAVLQERWEQTA